MRMPRHHFVTDCIGHGLKSKQPIFLSNGGVINSLQQQVPQFTFEIIHISSVNRIRDLIGFLYGIGGNGGEGLLDVPRTAGQRVA